MTDSKPTSKSDRKSAPKPAPENTRPGHVPFLSLGISAELLKAVAQLGFEETSPIQSATIPLIMAGIDVVGQSETGSGKTAAFCIPAIEKVDTASKKTQVLILTPTRELATQVADEVHKLAAFKKGVHSVPIYGGASYDRQFAELKRGAHIVVGTPGRLIDHMNRGTLDRSGIKILILDEADRMLDMGFQEDIDKILATAPQERQTVFFSATISPQIQSLVRKHSHDPRIVRIEQKNVAGVPLVEQIYYEVRHHAKFDALVRAIDFHDVKSGVIFCNTQRMVDELADALVGRGYSAERLHGGMAQPQRTRVMTNFKKAAFEFLVATDVAARGIDVNDLELVVNDDLPYDAEDSLHRIGRTGRAGRKGRAVTLVTGAGIYKLQSIERFTKAKIRREQVPSIEAVEGRRSDALFEKIRSTLESADFAQHTLLVDRLLELGHTPTDVASAILHHFTPAAVSRDAAATGQPPFPQPSQPPEEGQQRRFGARRDGNRPGNKKFHPGGGGGGGGPRFAKGRPGKKGGHK